jgi:dTDP-glucose 4,6-dehydratase
MMSDHCDPVNIGNPNELSIRQFAELILELTGTQLELINKDLPTDDPKQRRPDITKARNLLQWQPKVDLRDGLKKTIDWFSGQPL